MDGSLTLWMSSGNTILPPHNSSHSTDNWTCQFMSAELLGQSSRKVPFPCLCADLMCYFCRPLSPLPAEGKPGACQFVSLLSLRSTSSCGSGVYLDLENRFGGTPSAFKPGVGIASRRSLVWGWCRHCCSNQESPSRRRTQDLTIASPIC